MGLWPVYGPASAVLISSVDGPASGFEVAALGFNPSTYNSTANVGRITPLYLPEPVTIKKAFWATSTGPAGNMDVGIYDDDYQLIASTGSTAMGGASLLVEAALGPITLDRGSYYLAYAHDSTATAALLNTPVSTAGHAQMIGRAEMASAFPLPTTFVPVAAGGPSFPNIGLSQRDLVA